MSKDAVVFVHGFASSNRGIKAGYLAQQYQHSSGADYYAIDLNPTPQDFEFMTVTGMINRLRQFVFDHQIETPNLIGSSLGGLVSVHYAHRYRGVKKLLLLAPVLRHQPEIAPEILAAWRENGVVPVFHYAFEREYPLRYDFEQDGRHYSEFVPPAAPTLIIHGRQDASVPIQHSRDYVAQFPKQAQLIELDAEHTLNDQLALIWQQAESFFS